MFHAGAQVVFCEPHAPAATWPQGAGMTSSSCADVGRMPSVDFAPNDLCLDLCCWVRVVLCWLSVSEVPWRYRALPLNVAWALCLSPFFHCRLLASFPVALARCTFDSGLAQVCPLRGPGYVAPQYTSWPFMLEVLQGFAVVV